MQLYIIIAPTISLGFHQNIGLHTGTRANVVLLSYLLIIVFKRAIFTENICSLIRWGMKILEVHIWDLHEMRQ